MAKLHNGDPADDATMPIAIVGMGFRGPGDATNVENLWKMISEGRESWSEIPKERWNHKAFYHPDANRHGTYNVTGGHFIKQDLSQWDAPFFQMSATEAAALDPQQRLLLECTYEAMENSGTTMKDFCGSNTSVFAGAFCTDYTDILWRDPESTPMYQCTNASNTRSNLANRISYFFDLRGQSVAVDTACSTSLVGLHLGCQSLRAGESKLSIVAGANVILSHELWVTMSMMRFLSPEGRCYTFDERANGYARGEGVGVLLLKPLSDALRDGDTIRAVIRGTGSSQDGKTPGITMPNGLAQEDLIRSVYQRSGLNPLGTSFVECHGTGTQAGDPLETKAISRVFGEGRDRDDPVRIGSVKTNVGHLEATSGVAGVIKTVLMLENKVFLPNINFRKANPRIPLEEWKLKVPVSVEPWNGPLPRRASVNSFGYGGAIAHVVLESAEDYLASRGYIGSSRTTKSLISPKLNLGSTNSFHDLHSNGFATKVSNGVSTGHLNGSPHSKTTNGSSNGFTNEDQNETPDVSYEDSARLFVLSSFDEVTGKKQVENLISYLEEHLDTSSSRFLDDLAYTLNERRTHHIWRAAISARSSAALAQSLTNGVHFSSSGTKHRNLGFVFTGQGAQWCGMGKELISAFPLFRASLEKSSACLKSAGAPFDVIEELISDPERSQINRALYSQPLCSAVQIALVDLLASFGVKPAAVTGHSSGEIAAAYAIGALNLEDAMRVAYFRGVASTNLADKGLVRGSMMAVGLSKEEALPYLAGLSKGKAVIACTNSLSSLTISGDEAAIDELHSILEEERIFARKLVVEVAYHSHHMTHVAKEYADAISAIKVQPGCEVEFFSSVTGKKEAASDLGPDYWVSNMLNEVKFRQSLRKLCLETSSGKKAGKRGLQSGIDDIIEIGPHSALAGPIKHTIQADERLKAASITYHAALTRNKNAVDTTFNMLCSLFTLGYPLEMEGINRAVTTETPCVLVDLPPYPWNHSNSYWHESRKSKAYRNRPFARTDLLGALERTASSIEPRWGNHIRLSEIPWVRDHKIQSNIVYPAAGYIVMAIEAASQRAIWRSVPNITGYNLREIIIGAALVIPEDPGEVEIAVTLKSYSDSMRSPSDLWDEFIVSSVSEENRWIEHCRGLISIQTPSKAVNVVDGESQKATDQKLFGQMVVDYNRLCQKDIEVLGFYESISKLGLEYGETFACMTKARSGPGSCIGHIMIPDTAAVMPKEYQFPFTVHPATLDSLFHTIFVALGADNLKDPAVPVSVEEIFVSSSIARTPGDELTTYTSTKRKDNRSILASLTAFDGNHDISEPVVVIRGISCTTLEIAESQDTPYEKQRRAYNFKWKPDIDTLSPEGLASLLQSAPSEDEMSIRRKVEVASFYLLKSAVEMVENENSSLTTTYQQELWEFLKDIAGTTIKRHTGSLSEQSITASEAEQISLLDEISSYGPEGSALLQIGQQLPSLLRGELLPGSLVKEIDIAQFFGPSHIFADSTLISKFIELLGFKHPNLSILACGRLSGIASIPVLAALNSATGGVPCFSKFEYADIQFDLTDSVKRKIPQWSELISPKELDIEVDPASQDCALESYHIVIAFYVLESAKSVRSTLQNAHKLLKPGGKLLLIGRPMESLAESTLFGFLPSMLSQQTVPNKADETALSEDDWKSMLSETGYSRDATISNSAEKSREDTIFLTTLAEKLIAPKFPGALVVVDESDSRISARYLQEQLSNLEITVEITTFENVKPNNDQVCIVLSELKRLILPDPSEIQWDALKRIFLSSNGVLWVTRGASVSSSDPNSNLISGIARTVRSETGGVPILTLDLDSQEPLDGIETADVILSLFKHHFRIGAELKDIEHEYAYRGGLLTIPRLVEDIEVTKFVSNSTQELKPESQLFRQHGRPLRMKVGTPGLLDSMYFVDNDRFDEELPPDWVQMEIKASGFNFKDVMMALGQIPVKNLGLEASGIVTAVGNNVTQFQVGDRVLSYGLGLFSTDYRGPAQLFYKIPENLSFATAASLPITYATAYYSCHYIARLQKGESVLVHAASGGLGQAIIELCQLVGAVVFATVGTVNKKKFLMEHFKIPEEHIFFSRDGSFAKGVKRMTQGRGVDVIMNSLAGENLRLTWDCIAPWGRFVELGQRDIMINTRLEMEPLNRNATFSAFLLDDLVQQKPDIASKVVANVMELFSAGAIQGPSQIHIYSITEVEKALRVMQTGGHMGKLVAVNNPDDFVKVIPKDDSKNLLSSEASYLLVGGLGGIGRATALWMTEHGARNLILVNRSGLQSQEARDTVHALTEKGVSVAVCSCDITDPIKFQATVAHATKEMPPIKGVIQGAMVLRDTLFETMSLEDYKSVVRPKLQGTWNLHNSLPKDMDFFIMESSISGIIGNATQASYAAGNTFLDSFASYRNAQGLPATTIDLGAISDVGYLATNPNLRDAMQRQGFELIDQKTLLTLLYFAIKNPRRPGLLSQYITGLGTWHEGSSLDSLGMPLFSHFRNLTSQSSNDVEDLDSAGQLRKKLRKVKTLNDASELICDALVDKIATRAGVGVEHINVGNPISDYGIDSLVAVEIRNWISKNMESTIPILELLANNPLSQLAIKIAQRSRLVRLNEAEKP